MTIKNRVFNWVHKVKLLHKQGCENVGTFQENGGMVITKYDWKKPMTYLEIDGWEKMKG